MNRRENARLWIGLWLMGRFGVLSAYCFRRGFNGVTGGVAGPWRFLSMAAAKVSNMFHKAIITPVVRRQKREGRWQSFEQLFERTEE